MASFRVSLVRTKCGEGRKKNGRVVVLFVVHSSQVRCFVLNQTTFIQWSKLQPAEGTWDPVALAHYHDEIDRLRRNGIEVMVTLHHFSQPIWFDDLGGFEKMENKKFFIE